MDRITSASMRALKGESAYDIALKDGFVGSEEEWLASLVGPEGSAAPHTHAVTDLTATGTRNSTTYLRGDNTWATPAGGGSSPGVLSLNEMGLDAATTTAGRVTAINDAITVAVSVGKRLHVNAGTYALGANPSIVLPPNLMLSGSGMLTTIFTLTSGTCFTVGNGTAVTWGVDFGNLMIDGPGETAAGTVGLHIRQGRHCTYPHLAVDDCETGVICDGETSWTDGNIFHKPLFNRNKYGFIFTADPTYQSNNNRIINGSVLGNSPKTVGGKGVWFVEGQGNVVDGTDIEAYETGIHFQSTYPGGNRAVMPRIEDCTNPIVTDFATLDTVLVGHINPALGGNGTLTQYGARLQIPRESTLPAETDMIRGIVARQHIGGGQPDILQIGMQRGNGVTLWHDIPTVHASYNGWLSPPVFPANLTTVTALTSGAVHLLYLGKAPHNVTTCVLRSHVTTAVTTPTWAEVAIYRADSTTTIRRVGYTDVSTDFATTGRKTTTIALADVMAGDELWVAYGSAATTPFQLRGCLADDLESGVFVPLGNRPSLTGNFTTPGNPWDVSGAAPAWLAVRI